jgi:signal transduction histidine kinase
MRRRLRSLPLGAWLAIGFAVCVAVPALSAGATWWAVSSHQRAGVDDRLHEASALIARTRLEDASSRHALESRLAELGVVPDLKPVLVGKPDVNVLKRRHGITTPANGVDVRQAELGAAFVAEGLSTPVEGAHPKRKPTGDYEEHRLKSGPVVGSLFIQRPNGAVPLAAASAVGLLALALALTAGVVLLRRWVVKPLSRLEVEAERIAGGELDVEPVNSRVREVAEVGAALQGMAGGLRSALAEQHAAEQQRRFLVSAIAHDLRTPLFTLRGSLEAIEHGVGNGDHLHRAQAKARLLDRLVDALFTYSRLEHAGPELTHEALDAVTLAHEAADTVDPRIVVVAATSPVALDGDHAALLRVLVNLLENAVRHARSQVELHVRAEGDDVLFEVLDDGPGVAPDDLPKLFELLFRSDRARNSATGGAGLGLAIVQRLSAAHGGTVKAENRSGGGARFVVRFPRSALSRRVAIDADLGSPPPADSHPPLRRSAGG